MTNVDRKVIELALEALGTMDVFNPNRMEAITALRQAIAEAEKQDNFCDNNCVWTDHHPDCKLGKPNRQELQAKGEHPAPCARFCEANAFQIEIRNLKAKLENQHPEWYHTKKIHGRNVFYHKTEERSYMSGQITPLYTTPPQRKPLTDVAEVLVEAMSLIHHYGGHGWSKAAHDEGERITKNARKALAAHGIKEQA